MDKIRAFIAIEMPPSVVDIVRRSQQSLQHDGVHLGWVRPENVHLTIRFLGDIPADTVEGIRCAMVQTTREAAPFSLQVKGAGVFPGAARPRVVWLGLGGQIDLLRELVGRMSSLLFEEGFAPEKRAYRGHLTIGRVRGRMDTHRLKEGLAALKTVESPMFSADQLCLMKSDLTPRGAVYTPLVQVRIGDGTVSK